jgi:glucose-6-phosphate 1-dehydrogenase
MMKNINLLFPTILKVAAKTVSTDFATIDDEELDKIRNIVKTENRTSKIKSILEDSQYVEKQIEDNSSYKELMKSGILPISTHPSGSIFYLGYMYDNTNKS